jgi:hypothetical protein
MRFLRAAEDVHGFQAVVCPTFQGVSLGLNQ